MFMAMSSSNSLGDWAEQYALQHLIAHGFRCVQQQYHSRWGEIDLIVEKQQLLVFVEVKARSNHHFGQAHEMLSPSKQKKIIKTALHFLQHFPQYQQFDYRFDFMALQLQHSQHDNTPHVQHLEWIEDAFLVDEFFGV